MPKNRKRKVFNIIKKQFTQILRQLSLFITVFWLAGISTAAALTNGLNAGNEAAFQSAAGEFHVPVSVLRAISYNQTRWQATPNTPSISNGYGLMDLTTEQVSADVATTRHQVVDKLAKGDGSVTQPQPSEPTLTHYTLDEAAGLLRTTPQALKSDEQQNIRGAAAVLAEYQKAQNNGNLSDQPGDWYGAVAAYSGSTNQQTAGDYANDVFSIVKNGAATTTATGQSISLPAIPDVQPLVSRIESLALPALPDVPAPEANATTQGTGGAECPTTLNCRFIPAAYANNNPNDPTDYGNYDPAGRPKDMDIRYIVIHDTEGSYDSAINHFLDSRSYVSANYVMRSSDGAITQMVHNSDVPFAAGNFYANMHSINIEHEGIAAAGSQWYTDAMYQSSATLVRWLAAKYHIPLDRNHIIGHDNVPGTNNATTLAQHYDPGPYWNWGRYMSLIQSMPELTPASRAPNGASMVTIAPVFAANKQTITDCSSGTCVALPAQGSSIVYMRTQPSNDSPLVSDPIIHSDGSPGTTKIDDWSATASHGEQFALAGQISNNWVPVWFGGQKAWFYNPPANPVASFRPTAYAWVVKPNKNTGSIPVYGRPVPEASAFPSVITPVPIVPLAYTIPAGQSYQTTGENLPNDYYYDATYNYSYPADHTIVVGKTRYYQITFNHRQAFVKASDVTLQLAL